MIVVENVLRWNTLRFGLVLSGGGAKGAYEAGVIRALYDLDIADKIKAVSGTSIGALNMLTVPMEDSMLCENIWHGLGFENLISSIDTQDKADVENMVREIISAENIREIIMKNIDFNRLRSIKLYACAYSLSQMKPVYFYLNDMSDDDIIQAVLASSAIPYLFKPVEVQGSLYADGGVNDPVYHKANSDKTPINPLLNHKLDFIIVVYLSNTEEPLHVSHVATTRFIDIIPSAPLEIIKDLGTMDFTKDEIRRRIELGYVDTMNCIVPFMIEFLTNKG